MWRSSGRWKGPPWVPVASSPSIRSGPWWRANPPCHGPGSKAVFPRWLCHKDLPAGRRRKRGRCEGRPWAVEPGSAGTSSQSGQLPSGCGVGLLLLCYLRPQGQSSHHSKSFKCEAGAPGERALPPCERLRPGTKPSQQKRLLFSAPSPG